MRGAYTVAVLLMHLSLAKAQDAPPNSPSPVAAPTAPASPPEEAAADSPTNASAPTAEAPRAAPSPNATHPPAPAAPVAPAASDARPPAAAPLATATSTTPAEAPAGPLIGYPPQPGNKPQPGGETEPRPDWSTDIPYQHEGLFLRAALGPGYVRLHNDSNADRRTFTAISSSMQFIVGGTARRQVILGGAYFRDQLWRLRVHDEVDDGDEPDLSDYQMALSTFGLFTDVYFGPDSGWHVQALLGRGKLTVRRPSSSDLDEPTGFVFHGGLGREWWFAEAGLVGVVLSCTYARLSVNETSTSTNLRGFVPQLLVTGTYN